MPDDPHSKLTSAEWYDRSIDWDARVRREIPVLKDVFGPPGTLGILDAGCGTGHQASALALAGYRVTGLDVSADMLAVAHRVAARQKTNVEFVTAAYADIPRAIGRNFDGVYCLANSLAAAASRDTVRDAVHQFARCLRPGGRMFIQVLNFAPMRREEPCIRGPRVTNVDGVEYVSTRHFCFHDDCAIVSNITLWREGTWQQRASSRRLYPVTPAELQSWMVAAGMRVDAAWGGYDKSPFDLAASPDLIVVGTRG